MAASGITVLGSTNLDILVKQDRLNHVGETIIIKDALVCGGGKGANQAVQIARLGHSPRFVTPLGSDALGQSLRAELEGYGLSLDDVVTKEGTSGIGLVHFLADGTLTSTVVEGANGKIGIADLESRKDALLGCNWLVAQLELPVAVVEQALVAGAAAGAKVILNTAPAMPLSRKALEAVDVLIANEVEAGYYLEIDIGKMDAFISAGLRFAELYSFSMVVTLGPKGSVLFDKGSAISFPALDVPVVETTGAGDSYVGAFVVALAEGRDIQDACRFASCASSLTIQKIGGQRSMPDKEAVLEMYRQYFS